MGNGVILDTNCFSHVFNRSDKRHAAFVDFLDWLCSGSGHLVYGGKKYLDELKKTKRYLKIFRLLSQWNKAELYDMVSIDSEMDRIIHLVNDSRFDDPHLAAIVIVSKCRVICTSDSRSFIFLKRKDIYDGKVPCPKFYTGDKCSNLLTVNYVGKRFGINKKHSQTLLERIIQIKD